MKIAIRAIAEFDIPFTAEQLAVIRKCATSHYDARCRLFAIAEPQTHVHRDDVSGTLKRWERTLELYEGRMPCTANSRQIDTLFKILEMRGFDMSDEEKATADTLVKDMHRLWKAYSRLHDRWSFDLDTNEA